MPSDPPRKLRREEDGSVTFPNGMVRDAETGRIRRPVGKPDAVTKALAGAAKAKPRRG